MNREFSDSVAFLGGIFSPRIYDEVIVNSKGSIQNAADALQKLFIKGLAGECKEFSVINLPYLGSFPKLYKKLYSPNTEETMAFGNTQTKVHTIRYFNFALIKQYFIYRAALKALRKWAKHNEKKERTVVIYALFAPFLKAAVKLKKEFEDVRIIQIVPDLPEFMSDKNSWVLRMLKSKSNRMLNKLEVHIDGYVLLSRFMTERLPIDKQPVTIIEGISNISRNQILESEGPDERYILYTGTLARRYGILNLVKAFTKVKDNNIKLIICGLGDAECEIREYAAKDSRIIFKGQILREKAIELQQKATLLVNPRTPEGEFTKYSFPSKTMEYLASGTPTLMYRLPGIPDDYFQYFFSPEDESIDSLTAKMEEILAMNPAKLREFGQRGQNFVANEKNPHVQANKIVGLIELIKKNKQ